MKISDETRAALREELVNTATIAARVGVSRAAVSNWLTRHSGDFDAIVVGWASGPVFLWSEVQETLERLRLPNERYVGRRAREAL